MKGIKKSFLAIIMILCSVLMFGCGKKDIPANYTIEDNGFQYILYTEQKIITVDRCTYSFSYTGDKSDYEIRISYGDNYNIVSTYDNDGGTTYEDGFSPSYNVSPEILVSMVYTYMCDYEGNNTFEPGIFFGGIILGVLGIIMICAPEFVFKTKYWHIKDAEPSDSYMGVTIAFGIIFCIAAVIMILVGIF